MSLKWLIVRIGATMVPHLAPAQPVNEAVSVCQVFLEVESYTHSCLRNMKMVHVTTVYISIHIVERAL